MIATLFIVSSVLLFSSSFIVIGNLPWGNQNENKSFTLKYKYFFVILCFFIIGAFRPIIQNTDNWRYVELYQYIKLFGDLPFYLESKEIGYALLNILFAKIFYLPYNIFFGFLTALTWSFYIVSSYRYHFLISWMLFFTICNGFLFWSFNGVRQAVAITIFLYSIKFIIERKPFFYITTVFIATLFHSSAFLLLPLYLLVFVRFNTKVWLLLYIVSILLKSNSYLANSLSEIVNSTLSFLPSFSNYQYYTTRDDFLISKSEQAIDTGIGVIINLFSTLFILFFSKKTLSRFPSLNIFFLFFSIGAVFSNLFFSVEEIGRLLIFFNSIFGLLMAATIYAMPRSYVKVVFITFFVVYLSVFIKSAIDIYS